MGSPVKVALAGNPNCGKTTLFNALTGARQHVGNYPGVTVEHKEGLYISPDGGQINIVDLPGTYSLTAYSVEEVVARDYLVQEKPQVIINITDASNLERNLYLTCQFLELGIPLVIALNMIDVARDRGIEIDAEKLATLLGVPVVPIIARSGVGTRKLMQTAIALAGRNQAWQPVNISYGDDLDAALLEMEEIIRNTGFLADTYPPKWVAIKYLENDTQIKDKGRQEDAETAETLVKMTDKVTEHLLKTVETYPESIIADHRYGYIKSILRQNVISRKYDTNRLYTSDKIDKVLTNRLLGPVFMCAVLFGLYQLTFTYSALPVAWVEGFFGWLAAAVDNTLADGPLKSLLISGMIEGVGGVLGFVPLIMFMFFGIAVLEDSGYLARVAFMMDRIFRIFGLHGSSVMPFIVSGGIAGGCAVPGVMATRTLRSPKERMATLLTVPFMNCGAKVPVLALLIGVFFAEHQARYMFFFTLFAWITALVAAKILRMTVLRGESTPFVMELPPYRFPTLKGLLIHTWEKTWHYIKKAGTVILGISILIWALMTYPGIPQQMAADFAGQRQAARAATPPAVAQELAAAGQNTALSPAATRLAAELEAIDAAQSEAALKYSLAGRMGTALESISWLAGFDWRTNIALVGGFAAKELIISTLGTAYSLGSAEAEQDTTLPATLAANPSWNPVMVVALMVFIMFYSPCFVTVVCIAREAGSWKWAFFSMAFNTGFAFLLAVIIYQVGMAAGLAGGA